MLVETVLEEKLFIDCPSFHKTNIMINEKNLEK